MNPGSQVTETARFGPYVVYECLGAGGMATVHRATIELEDDDIREVALKRLLPQFADDKRFVEDLIREGKLAAQLDHPNIVRILELGRIGRTYFIAMDLVRGRPLVTLMQRSLLKRMKPPLGVVIAIVHEMLEALDHAHAAQIVHRDLTPSNLIVTVQGHLKIIDFGVAKALVGSLQTSSGLAKGKLGYMALEAVSGKHVDTRADIFSAGVVLWELIALRRLFHGETDVDVLNAVSIGHVDPPSRYNPDCPPELDQLVLKALVKSREERWSSAGEMADVLNGLRSYFPATERDVIAWLDELQGDTETEMKPFRDELSSEYQLAYGSDSATYDELELSGDDGVGGSETAADETASDATTFDADLSDNTDAPVGPTSQFLEMDTVISKYHERKT